MARREVVEIQCDRCGKIETQSKNEVSDEHVHEFQGAFRGELVTFADLCKRCRGTVENIFSRLLREKEEEPDQGKVKLATGSGKPKITVAQ
jgi:hypothetical protein